MTLTHFDFDFVCGCPCDAVGFELQSHPDVTFVLEDCDSCLAMIFVDCRFSCPCCCREDYENGSSVASHLDAVHPSDMGSLSDHASSHVLVSRHLDPPIASASWKEVGSHPRAHLGASGGHDHPCCKRPSPQTARPRHGVICNRACRHVGDVVHVQDSVSDLASHRGRAGRAQTTRWRATYRSLMREHLKPHLRCCGQNF